jgi:thiamine kinase-like enzyme
VISIPGSSDEITAEWLSDALALGEHPSQAKVRSLTVEPFGVGLGVTAELYRLIPTYAAGARGGPASFIAKVPSSRPEMRAVAAAWGLYEREVLFYRDLASKVPLRSPICYSAKSDSNSGRFIVVMEDLSSARACDQINGMSLDQARLAIESVARLHVRWWDRPELKALEGAIQPLGVAPYRMGAPHAAAWPAMVSFLSARVSKEMLRIGEKLSTVLDDMGAHLALGARTLCHGDYRASNLMATTGPAGPQLVVLDWQVAMQARGTFDIGYLMSASVTSELRREHEMALLRDYHQRLLDGGVERYDFEQCLFDYRSALLMGFTYLVQAGAAADREHPRTEAFFSADLGLAEFVG